MNIYITAERQLTVFVVVMVTGIVMMDMLTSGGSATMRLWGTLVITGAVVATTAVVAASAAAVLLGRMWEVFA